MAVSLDSLIRRYQTHPGRGGCGVGAVVDFRGPSAALDAELGPVVAPPADEETDEPSTTGIDLYRSIEKRADAEERKRLFYVATTRAADYLILSSSLAGYDPDELESDWTKLLAERFDITSTGEFRGVLPAGYETPHVRVTNTDPVTTWVVDSE